MRVLHTTPLELAQHLFAGVDEVPGEEDHPLIMAALRMVASWPAHDEVPWCSSVPYMACVGLDLPRPAVKGLRARSWLTVGERVELKDAQPGPDLVVFKRGPEPQPGPDVIDAPGHVAFFLTLLGTRVAVWGGNQSNRACAASYAVDSVLQARRLY